jgi:hypothetical protein
MARPVFDPLAYVKMKARRADAHFQSLQAEMADWALKPYSVTEKTDFEKLLHIVRIEIAPNKEIIAMLLGDFVCCLRSSLDQLAWKLAHLDTSRTFNEREQRQISFPIFKERDSTYIARRALFPPTVADEIDLLQPYLRSNACRDDPLWQLNELWNMDKHRTIPISPFSLNLGLAMDGWEQFVRRSAYDIVVAFPLSVAWSCNVDLKPVVSVDILFGDASFEVPLPRLSEINNFVRNDVIPRFMRFFA